MATIVITPSLTGYASITNFLLSSDAVHTFASNTSGTEWSLGNGTIVRTLSNAIYHTYDSPGIYKVNLLNSIETSALTVRNYLPESLSFASATTTAMPGASTVLVLNLTSNYAGPHEVSLYAARSNSFPHNENNGLWTHLNPQWKFLNDKGVIGDKITVDGTTVYYNASSGITNNPNDVAIGTTARITAYYVDDMPSPSNGISIIATKSYGDTTNSRTSATTTLFVSANLPTGLSITTDGIQGMQPFYWQNGNILHTINLTGAQGNIKFLPLANTMPIYIERVLLSGNQNISSNITFNNLSVKAYDDDNFTHTRGYIRDLINCPITANNVRLSAKAVFSVNYNTLSGYNFFTPITGTQTFTLTGVSTEFDILTSTHNSFRRFNESENFTCMMKDFVNAPTFKNSEQFFNQYFAVIAGAEPIDEQQIGQKIMEKISNFAQNHSDVEVCNLDQFLSLANQVDMKVEDFGLAFPERLKRVMDVASVEHKKVWGVRCPCKESFSCSNCCGNICKTCGKNKADNLGNELAIETATISVGTPVVIKYEQSDPIKYELYYPKAIGALTSYPLSSLASVNLKTPLRSFYSFYTYIDTPANNQVEGLINWSDEYTTITESASSADSWYGDNQILDSIFNLELHKGLGLLVQ
jgi:hypothetical protein